MVQLLGCGQHAGGDVIITQKVVERLGGTQRCPTMYGGPAVRAPCAATATAPEKRFSLSKELLGRKLKGFIV